MITLLIISLIFFSIIAILRLDLAVFFIILLLPSYLIRFNILGIPVTFLEIIILLSFIIWFTKTTKLKIGNWLKKRKERQSYPFAWEIVLILLSAFIACWVSGFSLSSLGILKAYFFEPIILYILILNVLPHASGRKKIILALTLSALTTSLLAIYQQITGVFIFNEFWANPETRRVVSWFGYPNAIGLFLAPVIMILSGRLTSILKTKNKSHLTEKILIIITITLSILAIYFAKSEGALVALLAAGAVFIFFTGKLGKIITATSLAIGLTLILLTPSLKTMALNKLTLQDLSGEIRKQQWRETMMTLKGNNFIFGNGLANYQVSVSPFHQEGIFFNRDKMDNFHSILYGSAELRAKYWQPVEIYMYPHNIILNFWSELGLIGLIAFLIIITKFLIKSFIIFIKNKNLLALGLFTSMLVIIIHGLVDVPYFKNDLSALFFIILALLASLNLDNNTKLIKKLSK